MRVLIVEDNQKISRLLKRGLTQEGFAVDVCRNGDDGYEMACSESYEVLIIDRMLPGAYEGTELCRQLRTNKIYIPILLLTARATTADKIEGLNSGADDYLVKPFDFDELVARVRALTRRPVNARDIILKYEDIELNTTTKEVKRADTSIALTAKEFSLLEYLMQNSGRILSKEAIIAHLWDYDSIVISNNVEVYIRLLRNKIDRPFGSPLIQTVKGFGYRLMARQNHDIS